MNVDHLFGQIGEFGREQKKYSAILCVYNIYAAFHMLQYSFVGYAPKFTCKVGDEVLYDECPTIESHGTDVCAPTFDLTTESEATVVTEWELICDKSKLGPITMSGFMAGVAIGAMGCGFAADAYGRRFTLLVCLAMMTALTFFASLTSNYWTYLFLRFVDGFFTSGYIMAMFVLLNELIGSSMRGLMGTILQCLFALGIMTFSGVAYFIRNWRTLTAFISAFGCVFLPMGLLLPESPRWLASKGRTSEAWIVMRKIANGNGVKLTEQEDHKSKSFNGAKNNAESSNASLLDLFRNPILRQLTVIQIFSWFATSLTYYGLTLAAAETGNTGGGDEGGRYYKTALSGAVEIPAYCLTILLMSRLGRKKTLCGFMISGGASLVALKALVPILGDWIAVSTAMFCKLAISAVFAIIYIHSGEIFPTTMRSSAMGLLAIFARIGGIFAPFVARLGSTSPNLHLLTFGGVSLAAGLLNLKLPETQGRPLPETVEDLLKWFQEKKSENAKVKQNGDYSRVPLVEDDDSEDLV